MMYCAPPQQIRRLLVQLAPCSLCLTPGTGPGHAAIVEATFRSRRIDRLSILTTGIAAFRCFVRCTEFRLPEQPSLAAALNTNHDVPVLPS